jgi:DNA repair exonuclease SbcCD nuclease subunit
MSRLLDLMSDRHIPIIFGNHDCANPHLDENDSLTLLAKAGAVELLDEFHLWACHIENRTVVIGGSPYRYRIPQEWTLADKPVSLRFLGKNEDTTETHSWINAIRKPGLMIWLTHHDLSFPNPYEAVVTQMNELPGIDYLINGHIHRRASADVVRGQTTWVNPGNIARRSRSDSIRGHVPSVLRMDIANDGQWMHYIPVPHEKADEVFYELALPETETADADQSNFVTGLALLQSRKTDSGAGLMPFLIENVSQFEPDVAAEILKLAELVLADSNPQTEPT